MLPVDNHTIYAHCSGLCSHAKVTYYGYLCSYHLCSHYYHSIACYNAYSPHGFHGLSENPMRVSYPVRLCRPLWPVTGLPGSHQKGVAQEKWSCGRPRSCLTYGLVLLVLPVVWSVHSPSLIP